MAYAFSERFQTWCSQLHESKMHYLQSKLLLDSLKEIVDSGEVTGLAASKVKKVLLFGDLNEFLDISQPGNDFSPVDRALLGILKCPEYERSVKLNEEEKYAVLVGLKENLSQKNQLIYEVCSSNPQSASEENLKKLADCIKSETAPNTFCDQYKEMAENIKKCYVIIEKCQRMLSTLLEVKLQSEEPLFKSVKKFNELTAQATAAKSKELLGDIKNEIFCDDGAAALEIIHSKQKEEIEKRKLELNRLKEEVAQYENLKSEGFESALDEFLLVSGQRKDKEKLKEDYVTGFEELKEG